MKKKGGFKKKSFDEEEEWIKRRVCMEKKSGLKGRSF